MSDRIPLSLLLAVVVICGCGGGGASAPTVPGDNGTGSLTTESSTDSGGDRAVADPEAVPATTARELILNWVGNVGLLADDPYRNQQFTVRGEVIRVTPKRWNYVDNYDTVVASVWLHGDAAAWDWLDETWITCVFEDAADVDELRPGQIVTIEGRYAGSPFMDMFLEDCRLVAAGNAPAGARENPPLPGLQEWKEIVARKDAFYEANKLPLEVNEERGLLWLELEDDLFKKSDEEVSAALDAVSRFPIESIECAGEGAAQLLTALQKFPRLRALELKGDLNCTAGDLARLREFKDLDSLEITGCDTIDDDFAAAIGQVRSLRFLVLQKGFRGYALTDTGVADLAKLPELRALKLSSNDEITDASLAEIAKLTELRALSFEYRSPYELESGVSDAGLAALPPGSLPKLVILDLDGQSRVTDAGIESLIGQQRHFALLNLGNTGVTEAGIQRVVEGKLADRLHVWNDYGLPEGLSDAVRQQLVDGGLIKAE
jgi:hypothetical protein